jgi:hypothetical protein
MNCNVAQAEQDAAREALSVSESELQRIKQRGCSVSQRDAVIMRNPDYKALPYPILHRAQFEEEDVNNKYLAEAQARGFVSPFVDEATNDKVEAYPAVPGLSMAGTGDLQAMASAYLASNDDDLRRIYTNLANLADTTDLSREPRRPRESLEKEIREDLYGSARTTSRPSERCPVNLRGIATRCREKARGALYDLMHFDAISPEQTTGYSCKLAYVISREGRLPYLLFALTCLAFVAYGCAIILSFVR